MKAVAIAAADIAWWLVGVTIGIPLVCIAFALEKHTQKEPNARK